MYIGAKAGDLNFYKHLQDVIKMKMSFGDLNLKQKACFS